MGLIRVLPPEVARRIAAGEVIEGPASVVKELCDNALDAGARRVAVELAEGGAAEIAVTDDGCGLAADDAPLAFARHATSKLQRFEDLSALRTLGFRGEALPSIAAVAAVEMVTRPAEAAEGTRVRVIGAGSPQVDAVGAPVGTRVVVRDLFHNLPVRRGALRSAAREGVAVAEVVTAAALARPDVAFRLLHAGREVLATPGDGQTLSAVVAIWGPDVAAGLVPVDGHADGWTVRGFCGTPAAARGNRGIQYVSVDGRSVRGDDLRGAVEGAYRHRLMVHRYPLFILGLTAEPGRDLYDANVHPSKREVRVHRPAAVRDLCYRAVSSALRDAGVVADLPMPGAGGAPARAAALALDAARPERLAPWEAAEGFDAYGRPRAGDWVADPAHLSGAAGPRDPAAPPDPSDGAVPRGPAEPGAGAALAPAEAPTGLPRLRTVGQVARSYLLAEGGDGLYLIDQHAAHERIYFEELAARGPGPGQWLLQPAVVALTAAQWGHWERQADGLAALGLVAEPFGDGTLLVRALPAGVGSDPSAALGDLLARGDGPTPGLASGRLALAACKAAVKAGQPLEPPDAEALLAELARCQDPFHCPHGRPTLLRVGFSELERHFGRR